MVKTMDTPSIDEIFKVANLAMKYCMGQSQEAKKVIAWLYDLATIDQSAMLKSKLAVKVIRESKFPVETMLVLSTAHVDKATGVALSGEAMDFLSVYTFNEYGWLIHVPSVDSEHWANFWPAKSTTDSLRDTLKYARDLGVVWLLLDADAAPISDLQIYDW